MAVRGLKQARRNTQRLFRHQIPAMAQKTMVEILIAGRTFVLMLTPIDAGHLINSAFIQHGRDKRGAWGRFGFTAKYAAEVHERPGTLKGQPRRAPSTGNYWDPDAEPQFVAKGFDENLAEFDTLVRRGMKL